jgi:hypothetical protein
MTFAVEVKAESGNGDLTTFFVTIFAILVEISASTNNEVIDILKG